MGGQYLWRIHLDFISFLLLVGGIGTGVCHILAIATPGGDVTSSGGESSIRMGRSECLGVGVTWGVCIFLNLFFLGWF